jgi:ubiquinone/menaquinone biosynthesis C-methylase UbiE
MTRSAAESEMLAQFDRSYEHMRAPVMTAIERGVCGCDYGGTSWTTREEAELLAAALGLTSNTSLLDVGAGSGWPALYLAKLTNCSAILADLPLAGLRLAEERAALDGLGHRCSVVQADGANLPLDSASIDAISHSDVLCCLSNKLGVLRESRRAIRPSGRMAFFVIFVADNLSTVDHAEAVAAGPTFVAAETGYPNLLAYAGWRCVEVMDVTATFAKSMHAMLGLREEHSDQLRALVGTRDYEDKMTSSQRTLAAIERGLLKRALFVAEPRVSTYRTDWSGR